MAQNNQENHKRSEIIKPVNPVFFDKILSFFANVHESISKLSFRSPVPEGNAQGGYRKNSPLSERVFNAEEVLPEV
jgi:hypothetical protein